MMKWLFLFLAVAAVVFAVLTGLFEEPQERAEGLRVCITASLVNFGFFYAIHWAQKRQRAKLPIQPAETTRGK